MSAVDHFEVDDGRARRNVWVLVAAQAILGAQLPIVFIVGGLAGALIADNPCFATLPISFMVFGSMTTAPWMSHLMQKQGRKAGFFIGALGGALGASVSVYALVVESFAMLLAGAYLLGIYMSAHGFYRFAAADSASEKYRPKAISYVMAGGLLAAIFGPQLNKQVYDLIYIPMFDGIYIPNPFIGSYLAIVCINLIGMLLFLLLDMPTPSKKSSANTHENKSAAPVRSYRQLLKSPVIVVAVICGMVTYSLMNLVMTSTSLAVIGCGFTDENANDIVSSHVLAMYIPAFFTGHLIVRFGASRIIVIGLALLGCAGLAALAGVSLGNFFLALILLGVGWNFGFIGATALLSTAHQPHERGKVQGMNDMMVFGCVTLASVASGALMNCSGGTPVDGWATVNLAMIPFLSLAGIALVWLFFDQRGNQKNAA